MASDKLTSCTSRRSSARDRNDAAQRRAVGRQLLHQAPVPDSAMRAAIDVDRGHAPHEGLRIGREPLPTSPQPGDAIAIRGKLGQWCRKRMLARQRSSPGGRRRRRLGTGNYVAGHALRDLPDFGFDHAGPSHFSDRIGRSLANRLRIKER